MVTVHLESEEGDNVFKRTLLLHEHETTSSMNVMDHP